MLTVTFTMLGDVVLARGISRYGDAVRDYSPVWDQIRNDFHRIEGEQFDSQGARGGNPWAPLSTSYEAWKQKHFPGMPILQLTGMMWGEFGVGVGMQTTIEPMKLTMTPSMQRAIYHQQGTRTMPQRKVVDLTEEDKMGWMKMIHNYIYDKAKEAHLA
jgi:hypothetical protein